MILQTQKGLKMIETFINLTMTDAFMTPALWTLALLFSLGTVPIGALILESKQQKKMIEKKFSQKELEKKSIRIPNNIYDFFIGLDKLNANNVIKNEEYNYLKKHLTPEQKSYEEKKEITSKKNKILSLLANKLEIDFYRESDLDYISTNTNKNKFSGLKIKNYHSKDYQSATDYVFVFDLFKELEKERMFFNIPKIDMKIRDSLINKAGWKARTQTSYDYTELVDFLLTPIDFSQHIDEYKELVNIEKTIESLKRELKIYLNKNGDDKETISLTEQKIREGEEKALLIIDELNKLYPFDKNYFEKNEEYLTMMEAKNEQTLALFNKANSVSFD